MNVLHKLRFTSLQKIKQELHVFAKKIYKIEQSLIS